MINQVLAKRAKPLVGKQTLLGKKTIGIAPYSASNPNPASLGKVSKPKMDNSASTDWKDRGGSAAALAGSVAGMGMGSDMQRTRTRQLGEGETTRGYLNTKRPVNIGGQKVNRDNQSTIISQKTIPMR